MKYIFFLFIMPFTLTAQFKNDDKNHLFYEEVVQANELTKVKLHEKVNEWVATSYNDSNSVIKMNTGNKIVVNGIFLITLSSTGFPIQSKIEYSLTVDFKEGRYKILVNNIYSNTNNARYPIATNDLKFEEWLTVYKEQISQMDKSLQKYAERTLRNEKKLKETYIKSTKMQDEVVQHAKTEIQNLVNNLQRFVITNNSNDW